MPAKAHAPRSEKSNVHPLICYVAIMCLSDVTNTDTVACGSNLYQVIRQRRHILLLVLHVFNGLARAGTASHSGTFP